MVASKPEFSLLMKLFVPEISDNEVIEVMQILSRRKNDSALSWGHENSDLD